jgi:RNA polymerase sigma-70 factor (ECF subfamily)
METIKFNQDILGMQENLKFFALKLTENEEDANDLIQETYLRALTNKSKFKEDTNIRAWLYTIMRNTFINSYRKSKRDNTFRDQTDNNYYLDQGKEKSFNSTDSMLAEKEINLSISQLDEDLRKPFMMHTEGFKYKEIADQMDIPIGTVKSRIFISRQRLAEELKEFKN